MSFSPLQIEEGSATDDINGITSITVEFQSSPNRGRVSDLAPRSRAPTFRISVLSKSRKGQRQQEQADSLSEA